MDVHLRGGGERTRVLGEQGLPAIFLIGRGGGAIKEDWVRETEPSRDLSVDHEPTDQGQALTLHRRITEGRCQISFHTVKISRQFRLANRMCSDFLSHD